MRRSRAGVLNPLRKGIPRAPRVLPVKEKRLAVNLVLSVRSFYRDASAGSPRLLGLNVSGNGLHFAYAGLAYAESPAAVPRLAPQSLDSPAPAVRARVGIGGFCIGRRAKGQTRRCSVDGDFGRFLVFATVNRLRRVRRC